MIYLYLFLYALLLIAGALSLGIGPDEAKILFADSGSLHTLASLMYSLRPGSELIVRLPNILVTLLDVYLVYRLARHFLRFEKDALFAAILFSLLPAIIAAGVLVNKAPFLIFFTLLFLFIFLRSEEYAFGFALILLLLDKAFAILFLALFFYYYFHDRRRFAARYAILFTLSILFFGFDVGGKPRNYFLDTFAIFAAIFSPLLFLYFFYVIYRILVKEPKDILFYISATPFLFALVLSFRQRIDLVDFAPFAVFGVLLMVRTFLHSLRVRLPKYRKRLLLAFWIVMVSLMANDLGLMLHRALLYILPPQKHFAKHYYVAKELAKKLKDRGITCIHTDSSSLQRQLRFYGIGECGEYHLGHRGDELLEIRIGDVVLERYFVTKRNENRVQRIIL